MKKQNSIGQFGALLLAMLMLIVSTTDTMAAAYAVPQVEQSQQEKADGNSANDVKLEQGLCFNAVISQVVHINFHKKVFFNPSYEYQTVVNDTYEPVEKAIYPSELPYFQTLLENIITRHAP